MMFSTLPLSARAVPPWSLARGATHHGTNPPTMAVTCPSCAEPGIPAAQMLVASAASPARCRECGSSVAPKIGSLRAVVGAAVQNVVLIGGMVLAFRLGSVWPFGVCLAASVLLPIALTAGSPLIVVTPADIRRARRKRWTLIAFGIVLVLVAGMALS